MKKRIPLAGDAGSHVDPLLGEGIAEAVITAMLAAQYIDNAESNQMFLDEDRAHKHAQAIYDEGYRSKITRSMRRKELGRRLVTSNERAMNYLAQWASDKSPEEQNKLLRRFV